VNTGGDDITTPGWIEGTKAGSLALILYSTVSLGAGFLLPRIIQSSQEDEFSIQTNQRFQKLAARAQLAWLTMRRLWMLSLLLFACCLFAMPLASSLTVCTLTIALAGISRAVTAWVPFALLGQEIAHLMEQDSWNDSPGPSQKSVTGSLVGIHNVAMALPQVIATIEATIIFWLLGSGRDVIEDVSVGWVIRAGCLPALGAAVLAVKLREDVDRF
jgi:solute carrier family 45, member 1/2/4